MIHEFLMPTDREIARFCQQSPCYHAISARARGHLATSNFFREEMNDETTHDEDDECTDSADGALPRERSEHIRTRAVTTATPVFRQRQCGALNPKIGRSLRTRRFRCTTRQPRLMQPITSQVEHSSRSAVAIGDLVGE